MKTDSTLICCLTAALALGLLAVLTAVVADPAGDQLLDWAAKHPANGHSSIALTATGSPEPSLTATLTIDPLNGPILLDDANFIEITSSFDRERIPERVVHAKGGGAHGVFTVTHDITRYTKAAVFAHVGLKTEVFVRMSTVTPESGSADTVRNPRGFAIKFYTHDGNWDLVGFSLPIFPIRDPILFSQLNHSRKRNPRTHLPDSNMFWDFTSLRPETIHEALMTNSDMGIPDGFRHMNGFGVHAFKFVNAGGDVHYAKFHLLTQQGLRNLTSAQATVIAGENPDYSIRDLYNAIAKEHFPRWKMYVQIISKEDAAKLPHAFDATKIWDESRFPLRPVGELVLNRNPENYFAEVEQAAFDPGNLVPGIEMSEDRLLQGRSFSYTDTQRHRLGANFAQLPINRPKNVPLDRLHNYLRDGPACLTGSSAPNYFPNSFGGPVVSLSTHDAVAPPELIHGKAVRTDSGSGLIGDNFSQPTQFYNGLTSGERQRLVENVVGSLAAATKAVQERMLSVFKKVSHDLYRRINTALEATAAEKKKQAAAAAAPVKKA